MPYKDKKKQAEYQRKRYHRRRALYLDGKVCEDCGVNTNLEFHHLDPTIKERLIFTWSKQRLEAELAKCIIVCEDCHEKRHEPPHGTRSRYINRKCRCDLCTEAQAAYFREYRARKARECDGRHNGLLNH